MFITKISITTTQNNCKISIYSEVNKNRNISCNIYKSGLKFLYTNADQLVNKRDVSDLS